MNQKLARLVLISLGLVLSSLAIISSVDQSFARQALQITPVTEWDEGLPVNPEDKPSDTINSPIDAPADTIYRTFSGTRFQPTSSSMT